MKKIILTLAALTLCSTAVLAQENKANIGIAVETTNHFFYGDEITYPFPFLDIRYNNFFITGTNIGYDVVSEDKITLSFFVDPFDGFPIKASKLDNEYSTINERKTQTVLGAIATYRFPDYGLTTLLSISGGERGFTGGTHLVKPYTIGEDLTLIPSIYMNFYSEDYTDYYFGIDRDELGGKIIHTYSPKSAYSFGAKLTAEYSLTEELTILAFLSADKFSSEVKNSPIIDNNTLLKVGTGIKYKF